MQQWNENATQSAVADDQCKNLTAKKAGLVETLSFFQNKRFSCRQAGFNFSNADCILMS
jgi:hypothetical protein